MRFSIEDRSFWETAGLVEDSLFLSMMAATGRMHIERKGEDVFVCVG